MFLVIETCYENGVQIYSDCFTNEMASEVEANDYISTQYASYGDAPNCDGQTFRWHVEAI